MDFPPAGQIEFATPYELERWFLRLFPTTQREEVLFQKIARRCKRTGVFTPEFVKHCREAVARHEAGHAVAADRLGLRVNAITIVSWEEGYCTWDCPTTGDERKNSVVATWAGQWAELQLNRQQFRRACSQIDEANSEAELTEICKGCSIGECQTIRDELTSRTVLLLEQYERHIRAVADELLRSGNLTGEQVSEIVKRIGSPASSQSLDQLWQS